jgi:hypothetical protein
MDSVWNAVKVAAVILSILASVLTIRNRYLRKSD